MSAIKEYVKSPFMVASGCITDTKKQIVRFLNAGAGAVVTKTIFRGGVSKNHEITRHESVGTFNTTLYSKRSDEEWVVDLIEMYQEKRKVITSLHANTPSNLGLLTTKMLVHKDQVFELGIACPTDCSHGKLTPELVAEYCYEFKESAPDALFLVKLAAVGIDNLHGCIEKAIKFGATGITLSDSLPSLYFTNQLNEPFQAGYSGSGIKPIVQRVIAEAVLKFPDVEFVGVGGVENVNDMKEYLSLGCSAVQAYSCIARDGVSKVEEFTNEIC